MGKNPARSMCELKEVKSKHLQDCIQMWVECLPETSPILFNDGKWKDALCPPIQAHLYYKKIFTLSDFCPYKKEINTQNRIPHGNRGASKDIPASQGKVKTDSHQWIGQERILC